MKDPRADLLPFLRGLARDGLEDAAAPFGAEAIRDAITANARKGFPVTVIRPLRPIDVRGTKIAKDGEAFLKREKIGHNWIPVTAPALAPDNPTGREMTFYELVIELE